MSLSESYVFYIFAVLFIVYVYAQYRIMKKEKYPRYDVLTTAADFNQDRWQNSHQQEDVFNISSRVQGQEHQWPTHNAHLSIDHIRIMNEMNKPPSYNDDPPSYEEAMRIAAALSQQGESSTPSVIVVAPKPTSTN